MSFWWKISKQCISSEWDKTKIRIHSAHTHTHTRLTALSTTTRVSPYQKGKTNLDFTEARGNEWQWHQLGHMQVCISLQTDNLARTPALSFFTGRMPFLPSNQQRQSNEGRYNESDKNNKVMNEIR